MLGALTALLGGLVPGPWWSHVSTATEDRQPSPLAAPMASGDSLSNTTWIQVDYGPLVDPRRLSHSGEPVDVLLQRLEGRPVPPPGLGSADELTHRLLDPLLEPYAFILQDALDSVAPAPDPPMVEVGCLWQAGQAQPAWADLLRARKYLVESDGKGLFRVCLPMAGAVGTESVSSPPALSSAAAAEQAWHAAWPVLRHVLAAERRRLAQRAGDRPEDHPLDVEVHAYVHLPARTLFYLGLNEHRAHVVETRLGVGRPPPDLLGWQRILEGERRIEGARLLPDGSVRWLLGDIAHPPQLLGRPLTLGDLAVAYRAVFHGGAAEPYMSLDRGNSPEIALVNYGGRLQDTALGLVSLLCDVRFKTLSVGIDILSGSDLRERLRRELPGFQAHLERMAQDARSGGVFSMQTRLWFYPDDVDLLLSAEGDMFATHRVRMTAAAERFQEVSFGSGREAEYPWTRDMIVAINRDYDALGKFFPELTDLDEVVRLLSLFTWLREAEDQGLRIPDLDALLAIELPPLPTPRRFPQLLTHNTLPRAGTVGVLDVLDQSPMAAALERLQPATGEPMPPRLRLRRALASLDRRSPEHDVLAKELEARDLAGLQDAEIELLAFRAERLAMHHRVLNTLTPTGRQKLDERRRLGEDVKTLSVAIGGVDLGMGNAVARAARRSQRLGAGWHTIAAHPAVLAATSVSAPMNDLRAQAKTVLGGEDSVLLPALELPDHGLGTKAGGDAAQATEASPTTVYRAFGDHWIQRGWVKGSASGSLSWIQTTMGADGPDVRSRRLIFDGKGHAPTVERVEERRFLRYQLEREGTLLRIRLVVAGLPDAAARAAIDPRLEAAPPAPSASSVKGLALLDLLPPPVPGSRQAQGNSSNVEETPTLRLRLRTGAGEDLAADVPRPVLQRLVLGREADLTPDRPLPGLTPPEKILGDTRRMMILLNTPRTQPPWAASSPPSGGEEDPVRLAEALGRWWVAGASGKPAPTVVLGTDRALSPRRWEAAPVPGKKPLLLLPEDAFPGLVAGVRGELARGWRAGKVASELPVGKAPDLVVLVSGEAPGLLGARLHDLAGREALRGRLLAVYSLAGPLRPDLPAHLMAEGRLAGLGVAEALPVGLPRLMERVLEFGRRLGSTSGRDLRIEDVPGPFVWFF